MIDFFGRPLEPPTQAQPAHTGADEWGCYGCAGAFAFACPIPITIVGPLCALYLCSDLCALAAGFGYAARARRVSEDSGFGWQIALDFAGKPVWFDDFAIAEEEEEARGASPSLDNASQVQATGL